MHMDSELKYIYNYIKYYYSSIEELDEKFIMTLSNKIRYSLLNSSFVNRKLDFYINNFIHQEFRKINSRTYDEFLTIKNHIYLLMSYYRISNGVNIEDYNVLLYEITRIIAKRYNYQDVKAGVYDSLIENMFSCDIKSNFIEEEQVQVDVNKDSIKYYVLNYLSNDVNKIFSFAGNINYLVEVITAQLYELKVDSKNLLNHEYDDLINYFIRKNLFNIKYTKEFKEIYNIVYKFVVSSETYMNITNEREKIEEEVFRLSRYLMKTGYSKNDINSKKCNDIMENHLRIDSIMVNSKKCNFKINDDINPNKIELNLNSIVLSTKAKPLTFKAVLSIMALSNDIKR